MNNENLPQDEKLNGDNNTEDSVKETEKASAADSKTGEDSGNVSETAKAEPVAESQEDENPDTKKKKKKKSLADSRKLRYGSMATAVTVVVIAVIVLINVVAGILNDKFPLKIDLTPNKLFTLSDASKEIAKNITQDVTITIFTNKEGFENPNYGASELNTCIRQFTEGVKQYNTLSDGKVTATYVDLDANPAEATKYSSYNVSAYDILFACGNRSEKISANDLFSYDSNSYYSSGSVSNFQSKVEQQLASKITMVTSNTTPVVEFLTGHEEDSTTKTSVTNIMSANNYSTKDLDITSSASFDDNCVMAVIAAPKSDYSQNEITKLRNWLDNSGNLDRHLIVIANFEGSCPNLYEFLKVEYGIEVTDNMVTETDASREYNGMGPFYTYSDISSTDYTSDLSGKKDLLPACLQLVTHNSSNSNETSITNTGVATFPKTARLTPLTEVLSQSTNKITQNTADSYPIMGMAYAAKTAYDSDNNSHKTNVLVSGSMYMFRSDVLSLTSISNEKTLVSLANGFTGNKNNVSIPSQSLVATALEFNTAQANIFWLVFVIVLPLGLLIAGIVVFRRRRRL